MRRTLVLVLVLVLAGCGGDGRNAAPQPPQPLRVPAHELLEREPYLGVSCPEPTSIGCDRVGLAVWLREPARSVEAQIGARRFALDDRMWSGDPMDDGRRLLFAGFLHPAGLREDGPLGLGGRDPIDVGSVTPRVRLWIVRAHGRAQTTTLRIPLHPGWG